MNNKLNTIDYYFQHTMALEYEITHQILLKKLLEDAEFAQLFTGINGTPGKVTMEPLRGKFDLQVDFSNGTEVYIECKLMSGLSNSQLKNQKAWLEESENRRGIYFLLGTKDMDSPVNYIKEKSGAKSEKIGHEKLLRILDQFLEGREEDGLACMARSYRHAIASQWEQLTTNWTRKGEVHEHFYYYSFFWQMQKYLADIETRMYPVTNPGGTQYILNAQDTWAKVEHNSCKGELYLELINNLLCIRCRLDEGEYADKRAIRRRLIDYFRPRLEGKFLELENGDRVSKFMYIVRMRMDFEKLGVERVAGAFREWRKVVKEYSS